MTSTPIKQIEINPVHTAVVDAACLAMAIDGEVTQVEVDHISHYISTLLEVQMDVVALLIENSLQRIQNTDVEEFLFDLGERVNTLEDREQTLIAVLMAGFSDGVITVEEEGLFFELADIFGLDEPALEQLILQAEHFYNQFIEVLYNPPN